MESLVPNVVSKILKSRNSYYYGEGHEEEKPTSNSQPVTFDNDFKVSESKTNEVCRSKRGL